MSGPAIPDAFVFTKMQTDAGEDIRAIRNRKELERLAGGTFWWGIGESKGAAVETLLGMESRPQVLFSLMLSRPSIRSREPGDVFLWQTFRTTRGNQPLPSHVIVTSGATRSGTPKTRYHALVCTCRSSILTNGGGVIDAGKLINIGVGGRPVGSSQVTSVVRYVPSAVPGFPYEIAARAELAAPYFADLAGPRRLSTAESRLLLEVGEDGKSVADWREVAKRLRRI